MSARENARNLTENYSHMQHLQALSSPRVSYLSRTIRYTFINIIYAVYDSMAAKKGVKRGCSSRV